MFEGEIPRVARRRNKEYLLNSLPTIESSTPAFHGIIHQLFQKKSRGKSI